MQRLLNTNRILSFQQALRETCNEKEFLNIGPTPHNEDCTQVGENFSDSIFECAVYIRQLMRAYGRPPDGCEFFIIRNVHDFGIYYDINIFYGTQANHADDSGAPEKETIQLNEEYALKAECGLDYWDNEAKQELVEGEHHLHVAKIVNIKKLA